MDTELIIAADGRIIAPNGSLEQAERLCAFVHARKDELLAQIHAIAVTGETMDDKDKKKEAKARLAEIGKVVEDLREIGKKLVVAACEQTETQRVLSQIDPRLWTYSTKQDPNAAYSVLSAALKAKKAEMAGYETAHTPPAPVHCYVIQMECTDAALKAVQKEIEKAGVKQFRTASPQSDKAFKALDKWFSENE